MENLISVTDQNIMNSIREEFGTYELTQMEHLGKTIQTIFELKEKCKSGDVELLFDRYIRWSDGDVSQIIKYLQLFYDMIAYEVNQVFMDWYPQESFTEQQEERRTKINDRIKIDGKYSECKTI